jgi:hypothetical protein
MDYSDLAITEDGWTTEGDEDLKLWRPKPSWSKPSCLYLLCHVFVVLGSVASEQPRPNRCGPNDPAHGEDSKVANRMFHINLLFRGAYFVPSTDPISFSQGPPYVLQENSSLRSHARLWILALCHCLYSWVSCQRMTSFIWPYTYYLYNI